VVSSYTMSDTKRDDKSVTKSTSVSSVNREKIETIDFALREILTDILRQGFYGAASIELSVADGTIQSVGSRVNQERRY